MVGNINLAAQIFANRENYCTQNKLPFMYWDNDYKVGKEDHTVPEDIRKDQAEELLKLIKRVEKYSVKGVQEAKERIDKMAKKLFDEQPKNVKIVKEFITIEKLEEYKEAVKKQKIDTQISCKTNGGLPGFLFGIESCLPSTTVIDYEEMETKFKKVPGVQEVSIPVEIIKPIEDFMEKAKKMVHEEIKSYIAQEELKRSYKRDL